MLICLLLNVKLYYNCYYCVPYVCITVVSCLFCTRVLQYTFSELLDIVQASETELRQALVDMKACLIHGKFFIVHRAFH